MIVDTSSGWYYYNTCGLTGLWADEEIDDDDGNPGGPLCSGGGLGGWYTSAGKSILMCPEVWEGRPTSLAPYLSGQQSVPIGEHIEELSSVPATFLHELMHFLGTNTATGNASKWFKHTYVGRQSYRTDWRC